MKGLADIHEKVEFSYDRRVYINLNFFLLETKLQQFHQEWAFLVICTTVAYESQIEHILCKIDQIEIEETAHHIRKITSRIR